MLLILCLFFACVNAGFITSSIMDILQPNRVANRLRRERDFKRIIKLTEEWNTLIEQYTQDLYEIEELDYLHKGNNVDVCIICDNKILGRFPRASTKYIEEVNGVEASEQHVHKMHLTCVNDWNRYKSHCPICFGKFVLFDGSLDIDTHTL